MSAGSKKEKYYTFEQIRKHRTKASAWVGIHGEVYDITTFLPHHPGGDIILTSLGRDATILFEIHHNLLDNPVKIKKMLLSYRIGRIKNYTHIANFDTPFSKALLQRCRDAISGQSHRESFYCYSALIFFYFVFGSSIFLSFYYGYLFIAVAVGLSMGPGHTAGHAGNHWSVSKYNFINKFVSMTCTNLWGLREKNWEFSHLISHHCYNYTERDYIMEQHVPSSFFRIRDSDPWLPLHKWQHISYLFTPLTSFLIGALRFDCVPWLFISPLLASFKMNKSSPFPAPQFFAWGSNVPMNDLKSDEDGVGPTRFVVFRGYEWLKVFGGIVLSNIIWLPLFFTLWQRFGLVHAVLFNSIAFGTQSFFVTRGLLTQHLCEDIKLQKCYRPDDDYYKLQIEASTSVHKAPFRMWGSYAISLQTEHHVFPAVNPLVLIKLQPVVKATCKEFGVQYNEFASEKEATASVYRHFLRLSVKPVPA